MQSIFTFGKKRRVSSKKSRKGSRKSRKGGRKPPSRLLKMCKRLGIKTTVKRGSKRVYKSTALLLKMSRSKLRMRKMRKSRFGAGCSAVSNLKQGSAFGKKRRRRRSRKVKKSSKSRKSRKSRKGRKSRRGPKIGKFFSRFTKGCKTKKKSLLRFGKKRKSYVSRKTAMKAFKSFYNKNCSPGLKGRSRFGTKGVPRVPKTPAYMMFGRRKNKLGNRSRFGTKGVPRVPKTPAYMMFGRRKNKLGNRSRFGAGNPPLMNTMGYSFCPEGNGGVLMSSGLFPTGCNKEEEVVAAPRNGSPTMETGGGEMVGGPPELTAFGKLKRKYKYRNVVGACSGLKKKRCRTNPNCHYVKNRGCKGRSGTKKGMVYEGPEMY